MSVNSNIKLINEIKNVSNNLIQVILQQTISSSKLIELESGLNKTVEILNKLNVNLMDDNKSDNKETKLFASGKMPLSHIDNNIIKKSGSDLDNDLIIEMLDKTENSIKKNTLPIKEYDENTNVNNIQNKNDCSEDDDLLIQHALKIETSLNETPIKPSKRLDENNSPAFVFKKEISSDKTKEISSFVQETKPPNTNISFDDSIENEKYTKVLKRYFGFSKFRPTQLQIIKNIIENKKDQLVILATGQGKSLCYQYPSLYLNGLTLVISPLISLMEDQVAALKVVNVEACLLGSTQNESMENIRHKIFSQNLRLLYLTPEFLETNSDLLIEIREKIGISLVAIDECHCVSQWGNDFRSSYRKIGPVRRILKDVPFIALTATATPAVRRDILKSLELNQPIVTISSFDRPNLYLSVNQKSNCIISDLKKCMIFDSSKQYKFDGPTIIYCITKQACSDVNDALKIIGLKSDIYHAGISLEKRRKAQVDFTNDNIDVIVATVAFGMGIDKPDIRNVIHYGSPKDLESYYQEIGRGGRDGLPSKCVTFYTSQDFNTIRYFIQEIKNEQYRNFKNKMFARMQKYLSMSGCRREYLLKHFEEEDNDQYKMSGQFKPNCCDNCTNRLRSGSSDSNQVDELKDFSKEAHKLLSVINLLNSKFGIGTYISFLIGSKAQKLTSKISENTFKSELHGSGKEKSEAWWKIFAQQLQNEDYIRIKALAFGSIGELTDKANDFLLYPQKKPVKLYETKEMKNTSSSVSISLVKPSNNTTLILPFIEINPIDLNHTSNKDQNQSYIFNQKENELHSALLNYRTLLAQELNVSAHKICTNTVVKHLVKIRPSNIENLAKIEEFPTEKLSTIGQKYVNTIIALSKKLDLKLNNFTNDESQKVLNFDSKVNDMMNYLTVTKKESYLAFQDEKKNVETIAKERNLSITTISGHLGDCIELGLPIDYSRLNIKNEDLKLLEEKIRLPPINSNISKLGIIKEQVPNIDWDGLRLMVSILKRKYGLNPFESVLKDSSEPTTSKQAQLVITKPATSSDNIEKSDETSTNERVLPSWMKRAPSQHDIQNVNLDSSISNNKAVTNTNKKKPKLNL